MEKYLTERLECTSITVFKEEKLLPHSVIITLSRFCFYSDVELDHLCWNIFSKIKLECSDSE